MILHYSCYKILTIFPVLYNIFLWLIYFIHSSLDPLIPYPYLAPPRIPVVTTGLFFVPVSLVLFCYIHSVQFSCSVVSDFLWSMDHSMPGLLVHHQSQNLPKLMSIESVMPSNHLILCCSLLLLPSVFLNNRVFSNESALRIRWPKYWNLSFNISPSYEHSGLTQSESINSSALSFLYGPTLTSIHDYWKNHSFD